MAARVGFSDSQFAFLIIIPLLFFNIVVVGYPLAYSFYESFFETHTITQSRTFVGFGLYLEALKDPNVTRSLSVTAIFVAIVTLLSSVLGLAMALIMNENFFGRTFLRTILILPWAVSEFVGAVTWRFVLADTYGALNGFLYQLGLIQTYQFWLNESQAIVWLAISFVWHFAPLGAYFFLSALQTVPEDLYNQSKADGAGPLKRFGYITFPYLRYSILIVLVLATLEAFRVWDTIFVITYGGPGKSTEVLTFRIYRELFDFGNLGYACAISYLLLSIAIIVTIIYFMLLTKRKRGAVGI